MEYSFNEGRIAEDKEIIAYLREKIKLAKKDLERATKEYAEMVIYDDCGQFYADEKLKCQIKLDVLISLKISIEKKMKKNKYND